VGRAAPATLVALTTCTALVALATLAGCAAESKLLRADASFTAASLAESGLAVVGVVQKDEVAQVRPPLIAALEAAVAAERADIPLLGADRVRDALGADAWKRLLNAFQARGTLDSAATGALARAVGGEARYAVVARVIRAATRTADRESEAPRDSTRFSVPRYLRIAGRDARVDVQVYDLTTGALVRRAEHEGWSESARYSGGPYMWDLPPQPRGPTVMVGPRAAPPPGLPDSLREEWGFPDPPPLAEAADMAFRAFARGLPR
jgi:hypothetical protein